MKYSIRPEANSLGPRDEQARYSLERWVRLRERFRAYRRWPSACWTGVQPGGGAFGTGSLDEQHMLRGRQLQCLGQAGGDGFRGAALVGLDLLDGHHGAADALGELGLGQVEGSAVLLELSAE